MKKLLFIGICCMMFCGCGNKEEIEALKGTWIRNKTGNTLVGANLEYLIFNDNNEFTYKVRLYNYNDSLKTTEEGYHIYKGNYKLKNNIIYISINEKDTSFSINNCKSCNYDIPSDKLIIDFNSMKICERDEGINCEYSYTKNAK